MTPKGVGTLLDLSHWGGGPAFAGCRQGPARLCRVAGRIFTWAPKEAANGPVQRHDPQLDRRPAPGAPAGPLRRRAAARQGAAEDGRGGPQPRTEVGIPATPR